MNTELVRGSRGVAVRIGERLHDQVTFAAPE